MSLIWSKPYDPGPPPPAVGLPEPPIMALGMPILGLLCLLNPPAEF
jgi:hypothetical protein